MSRRWQAFWLVVGTLICLAVAPIGAIFAIMSPLVFDGPGNLLNPVAWFAFLLVIGLWIVCILAPFGAWVGFLHRHAVLTWGAMAAPFAWAAILATTLMFVPS
jgi:hypothetical protein